MAHDPKYDLPEYPTWQPVAQDALEQLAYDHHRQIEVNAAWGIATVCIAGTTYYTPVRKIGGVA